MPVRGWLKLPERRATPESREGRHVAQVRALLVDCARGAVLAFAAVALAQAISRQADPADRAAGAGQRDRQRGARVRGRIRPQLLNQTIIIENKPGAAFTIGLDLVAKATPDGYTLGMGPVGALAISPNMVARLPFNVEKDFQPIVLIARGHLLLAVVAEFRYQFGQGPDRRGARRIPAS